MTEFDKVLQDNLKNGAQKTPSFVWDNIEEVIENKKKGGFFFLGCLGLILLLIGTTVSYYWFNPAVQQQQGLDKKQAESIPVTSQAKENKPSVNKQSNYKEETNLAEQLGLDVTARKPQAVLNIPFKAQSIIVFSKDNDTLTFGGLNNKTTTDSPKINLNISDNNIEAFANSELKQNIISIPKNNRDTAKKIATISVTNTQKSPSDDTFKGQKETTVKTNNDSLKTTITQENESLLNSSENFTQVKAAVTILKDSTLNDAPATDASLNLTTILFKPETKSKDIAVPLLSASSVDSIPKKTKENNNTKKFFIQTKVGFSTYKIKMWDSSFELGILSKRNYQATGINVGLAIGYEINRWLNPILCFNYNAKQAAFRYSALYDDQGYLIHNIRENSIPLNELNDNDFLCNKYLLEGIEADFSISSFSLSFGNKFKLLQAGKFGLDIDLNYSLEISSNVNVYSIQKIDVSTYLKDALNSRFNTALNLNYQWKETIRFFLEFDYIYMPNTSKSSNFYRGDLHELMLSIGIRFNL